MDERSARDLSVDPGSHYLSDSDTSSTVSIPVSNPSSVDREVKVDILENGAVIDTETVTLGANGGSNTFSTTVDKSVEGEFTYSAIVTETDTGVSGRSNEATITWIAEENEFANIEISAFVEDTGEADNAGNTVYSGAITAGSGGATRFRVIDAGPGLTRVSWEDEEDFDFFDCDIIYDDSAWEDQGYQRIEIYHRETSNGHKWWIGPDSASKGGYYVGSHPNDPENVKIFEGLFYQDGVVTDLSGNDIGSWK